MVHEMVEKIKAKPDIMSALRPAGIRIECVGLVIAKRRVPSFGIAEGRIVRHRKRWHTAFAWIRPVCPGNPQHLASEVGAEVRCLHVLAKSGPAEGPVDQEVRRDGIGLSDARYLHERVAVTDASGAQTWAASRAQAEVAMNQRVHDAVLEPEIVLLTPVPIDLAIEVVAVQALCAGFEIVVYVPGQVWARDQGQQFRHGAVQPGSRDDVDPSTTGKYGPVCAIRVAGEGIKDHPLPEWCGTALCSGHQNGAAAGIQNLGTQFGAEISRTEDVWRDRKERGRADALEGAFPVSEEKQLVSLDRSADAAPVEVSDAFGFFRYAGSILIPQKSP